LDDEGQDGTLDEDETGGEFLLTGLLFGTYTLEETVPPDGYQGDPAVVTIVIDDLNSPNANVSTDFVLVDGVEDADGYIWVNKRAGRITHTNVTCEIFNSGEVDNPPAGTEYLLDAVEYSTKGNPAVIRQVNPGVFFYWTKFEAPDSSFTVDIVQSLAVGSFQLIGIQNDNQVQLWDGETCEALGANYTLESGIDGLATLNIFSTPERDVSGDPLIISVKYDPGTLKDQEAPAAPVKYSYETVIGGETVDNNSNGLWLIKKGDPIP
jgi:hypothetical protein